MCFCSFLGGALAYGPFNIIKEYINKQKFENAVLELNLDPEGKKTRPSLTGGARCDPTGMSVSEAEQSAGAEDAALLTLRPHQTCSWLIKHRDNTHQTCMLNKLIKPTQPAALTLITRGTRNTCLYQNITENIQRERKDGRQMRRSELSRQKLRYLTQSHSGEEPLIDQSEDNQPPQGKSSSSTLHFKHFPQHCMSSYQRSMASVTHTYQEEGASSLASPSSASLLINPERPRPLAADAALLP